LKYLALPDEKAHKKDDHKAPNNARANLPWIKPDGAKNTQGEE
jgi:hypothetical protein